MAATGHGVSAAVRNHIAVWVSPAVSNAVGKPHSTLSKSSSWKRVARRNSPSGYGYEREFRCEGVPKVKLIVHSPESDYTADSYVFLVNDKPVAGGKTSLKSVHTTTAISIDKTKVTDKAEFTAMSAEELDKIQVNLSYGKGSYAFLELERG